MKKKILAGLLWRVARCSPRRAFPLESVLDPSPGCSGSSCGCCRPPVPRPGYVFHRWILAVPRRWRTRLARL